MDEWRREEKKEKPTLKTRRLSRLAGVVWGAGGSSLVGLIRLLPGGADTHSRVDPQPGQGQILISAYTNWIGGLRPAELFSEVFSSEYFLKFPRAPRPVFIELIYYSDWGTETP